MINKDVFGPHKMYAELEFEPDFYLPVERDDETFKSIEEFLEKNLHKRITISAWDDYDDYEE